MIKIDKDIPIPEIIKGRKSKYPINEMEVGDSFFIEGGKVSITSSLNQKLSRVGKKRLVGKIEGTGLRIWRIK